MQQYWEQHPLQYEIIQIVREGQWVTHVFEWVFMMVSRFAGYLMTLAIGYLIYYAIEFKHSLDAVPAHPTLPDTLASCSNVIINVGPELVFPGVVVLCIRAFTARRWLDGALYMITTMAFVVLTMVLLNAFMNNGINKEFLAMMLFWRAFSSLFYTVVAAYCGGHSGLDFHSLLSELDTLRQQLDSGQQTLSSLREHLSSVQQRASTLGQQLDSEQQEMSHLRRRLAAEQQRAASLQAELEVGHDDTARLRRELSAAQVEADTLRTQLEGKKQELEGLRKTLESGQEWQVSRFRQLLEREQQRASLLQEQLDIEQTAVTTMRRQLNTALVEADGLRAQLEVKQPEVEGAQAARSDEQKRSSQLRLRPDGGQSVQGSRVHSSQVVSGQAKEDSGQGKVVHLDTNRPRKSGQDENAIAEQVRQLLIAEPGLSGRAMAARIGCSPTTAAKWKAVIEGEQGRQSTEKGGTNANLYLPDHCLSS
jgi:predicted  nucleic acid-binding Zn-ribbon protein